MIGVRFLSLFAALLSETFAWSSDSHKIVAHYAATLLSNRAARFVKQHITETSIGKLNRIQNALVSVSGWADSVEWSRELHFAYTPFEDCQPFVFERDCGRGESGRCIVSAIANYTMRASDVGLSRSERAEAIKFLVHLMADIHNPMHLGFEEDFGGNSITVDIGAGESDSLHEVWDWRLTEGLKQRSSSIHWRDLAERRRISKSSFLEFRLEGGADAKSMASQIASETTTLTTCRYGYQLDDKSWIRPHQRIPETYMETRGEIAWTQLEKSASRLAHLLEQIAQKYFEREFIANTRNVVIPQSVMNEVGSSNPFSALYDGSLEEHVFELDAEDDSLDSVVDEEELSDITSTASPVVARRRFKKNGFVLIKRNWLFIITLKSLIKSESWQPATVSRVVVWRKDGKSFMMMIDHEAIDVTRHDHESLLAIFIEATNFEVDTDGMRFVPIIGSDADGFEGFFSTLAAVGPRGIKFGKRGFNQDRALVVPSDHELMNRYKADPISGSNDARFGLTLSQRYVYEHLDSMQKDLVVVKGKELMLVSSYRLLSMDTLDELRNPDVEKRMMVNFVGINQSSSEEVLLVLIDSRIADVAIPYRALGIIHKAFLDPDCIGNVAKIMRHEPPLFRAFVVFNEFLNGPMNHQRASPISDEISEINSIIRNRKIPGASTIELVFRT